MRRSASAGGAARYVVYPTLPAPRGAQRVRHPTDGAQRPVHIEAGFSVRFSARLIRIILLTDPGHT